MPDRRAARMNKAGRIGLALLAGGLQALSIATPWNGEPQAWLQLLSLGLLAWLLLRPVSLNTPGSSVPLASAAALGWLFATAWLAGSYWWMFIAMHRYGGLPAPMAVLAVLALSGTLALYAAAACAVYAYLAGRLGPVRPAVNALLFAALWLLAELARGSWFTGFGWAGGGLCACGWAAGRVRALDRGVRHHRGDGLAGDDAGLHRAATSALLAHAQMDARAHLATSRDGRSGHRPGAVLALCAATLGALANPIDRHAADRPAARQYPSRRKIPAG